MIHAPAKRNWDNVMHVFKEDLALELIKSIPDWTKFTEKISSLRLCAQTVYKNGVLMKNIKTGDWRSW